ncbi:MAG: hypothetical protein IT210_12165 [Armatimonadetes bacterium]|nr:hypothetical protein [Armatimonadota bacterium]
MAWLWWFTVLNVLDGASTAMGFHLGWLTEANRFLAWSFNYGPGYFLLVKGLIGFGQFTMGYACYLQNAHTTRRIYQAAFIFYGLSYAFAFIYTN